MCCAPQDSSWRSLHIAISVVAVPTSLRPTSLHGFGGSYSDANHPGCARRITLADTSALISGTDEDGTPFKARGTVAGKTLTVDLGGAALLGTWNGLGIVFSDGNTWTKN